jgi:hypothetical protein
MTEQVTSWSEAREMTDYRPGQKVQIKHQQGVIDTVIAYDPMIVPPIVLAIDPQPRYPEELILISQPVAAFNWRKPWSRVLGSSEIPANRQLVSSR